MSVLHEGEGLTRPEHTRHSKGLSSTSTLATGRCGPRLQYDIFFPPVYTCTSSDVRMLITSNHCIICLGSLHACSLVNHGWSERQMIRERSPSGIFPLSSLSPSSLNTSVISKMQFTRAFFRASSRPMKTLWIIFAPITSQLNLHSTCLRFRNVKSE